jgi:hypothetical protein
LTVPRTQFMAAEDGGHCTVNILNELSICREITYVLRNSMYGAH